MRRASQDEATRPCRLPYIDVLNLRSPADDIEDTILVVVTINVTPPPLLTSSWSDNVVRRSMQEIFSSTLDRMVTIPPYRVEWGYLYLCKVPRPQ